MPSFLHTQQPVVADAKSCEAWLARATLADPKQACHELTGLLEALEDVSPPESTYLEILERLREPIVIAQAEHGKKFAARPLPLKEYEISAFEQVFDLWATLGRAFRRLLRAAIEDASPDLAGKEALLAQRALDIPLHLEVIDPIVHEHQTGWLPWKLPQAWKKIDANVCERFKIRLTKWDVAYVAVEAICWTAYALLVTIALGASAWIR